MRNLVLVILLTCSLFGVDATIKIEKDVEERARITLIDGSKLVNEQFFQILLSDLKISGNFLASDLRYEGEFGDGFVDPVLRRQDYVLKYRFSQENGTRLDIRLLQASDGTEVFQKSYSIPTYRKMPFLSHKAVSDVNRYLKFGDISWINRYVVYTRYVGSRKSEIVLADYTFTYQKVIVRGGLNLFPKWADARQRSFYFTSFVHDIPTLFRLNIYTGKKEKVIRSEGMLVCSDVSKDFSKIIVTMAPDGQPDIYEYDLKKGTKTRVTRFGGIDVNGKYLNEKEDTITFVSNRLGYANIFQKGIHATAIAPVVYHGRNNNACDAHDGKVVYASRESESSFGYNSFNLYLTSTHSTETRPLTTTGTNQFPRFTFDGSVILFIKQSDEGSAIGYINLKSYQSLLFPISEKKIQSIDW